MQVRGLQDLAHPRIDRPTRPARGPVAAVMQGLIAIVLVSLFAFTAGLPADASGAEKPAPVPAAADVEEATKLIQQVYASEYEGLSNNPAPLIAKLLEVAEKTENPARKYAALLEAEAAAVSGGRHAQAFELIDQRAAEFQCDGLGRRLELLTQWIPSKPKASARLLDEVYEMANSTATKALESQQFAAGESAARMALGIANQMHAIAKGRKDGDTMAEADEKQRDSQQLMSVIKRMAELHAEYVPALDRLDAEPEDPALTGRVGQFLCLAAWDWNKGLESLARGDVPRLSALAADELKARSGGGSPKKAAFGLATAWWRAAESEENAGQAILIRAHAGQLYEAVVKELSDPLDKELALQRIAGTETVINDILRRPDITSEPATEWLRDRPRNGVSGAELQGGDQGIDALAVPGGSRPTKRAIRSTAIEGASGGKNFTDEEPPEGAVLSGFYVFTTASWVDAIQVVYRLPSGKLHYGEKRGGNSGKRKIFKINPGERLTGVSGSFSENVVSLQFHTDQRISDPYGAEDGETGREEFDLRIPSGGTFLGFGGRSDFSLNALGLRYLQDE